MATPIVPFDKVSNCITLPTICEAVSVAELGNKVEAAIIWCNNTETCCSRVFLQRASVDDCGVQTTFSDISTVFLTLLDIERLATSPESARACSNISIVSARVWSST